MNSTSFSEIKKIRFLAVNYSRLQGLRALPTGLLLLFMVIWTNSPYGTSGNLDIPILAGIVCLAIYILIDRYYRKTFGRTQVPSKLRRIELLFGIIAAAATLAAFWLDSSYSLPISLVGLIFAFSMLADYFRTVYYSGYLYAPVTLAICLIIAIFSILPLLGWDKWWLQIGVKGQMLGVLMITGILSVIWGLVMHFNFLKALPQGTDDDKRI